MAVISDYLYPVLTIAPKTWDSQPEIYTHNSKNIPINHTMSVTDNLELNRLYMHGSATRPYAGPRPQQPAAERHCVEL